MDEVSRVIGTLEAGQAAQEKAHATLAAKVDGIDAKLDKLLAAYEQRRGAGRILSAVAIGSGSVVGAVIGWVVEWFSNQARP